MGAISNANYYHFYYYHYYYYYLWAFLNITGGKDAIL